MLFNHIIPKGLTIGKDARVQIAVIRLSTRDLEESSIFGQASVITIHLRDHIVFGIPETWPNFPMRKIFRQIYNLLHLQNDISDRADSSRGVDADRLSKDLRKINERSRICGEH